jgi:putative component of membrane protein insertase Oxa1/YidC/SpoIIIJ protein YidD
MLKSKIKKVILVNALLFLSFQLNLFAQNDWEKWEKKDTDYRMQEKFKSRDYDFNTDNAGEFFLKSVANTYWFFISDVDGNNCPFTPSCSAFFVDAVKETNVLQGTLMFFDRFTRDLNIFKYGNYPLHKSKHFYDPANLYTLSKNEIKYIPPDEIVTAE